MNEQKNLFLAIAISIAIIVFFQFLMPTPISEPVQNADNEIIAPATSIDEPKTNLIEIVKPKEDVIIQTERVNIQTRSVKGSINLKGALLDDLILLDYYETTDKIKNINLLYPEGTSDPYYVEFGWGDISDQNIEVPDLNTIWKADHSTLNDTNTIKLSWTNNQNVTFEIYYSIDNDYMFSVKQNVINNGSLTLNIYPYRLIKRINTPKTINFFILHEGLINLLNDELDEKKYDDLHDDCKSNSKMEVYCSTENTQGGWLGFTDKNWMSVLIPDPSETINASHRYNKVNGRDSYRTGYATQSNILLPGQQISHDGKIFAGAKKLESLNYYSKSLSIPRFTDAIDWGWFAFLTKPIAYAIIWFDNYVKNFGLAIIAFTILMRLILFPLAHASFKSMAKMKKLQPEMQRLKETYPNDRQKMQQELMALYKREGANPVAGCLPILVQIPIFFSLYKVLFVTIETYHQPFYGWIIDLSAQDPAGILILFGLFPWDVPGYLNYLNIGILPILMGFTMWLQQKLNPAPTDPTQAKIFALLPFVYPFVLGTFAAGLVLYWTVNNILSIAQQWFIQRKILAKNE